MLPNFPRESTAINATESSVIQRFRHGRRRAPGKEGFRGEVSNAARAGQEGPPASGAQTWASADLSNWPLPPPPRQPESLAACDAVLKKLSTGGGGGRGKTRRDKASGGTPKRQCKRSLQDFFDRAAAAQ
eukprot:4259420-Pyramimonas_sp.AAC.1